MNNPLNNTTQPPGKKMGRENNSDLKNVKCQISISIYLLKQTYYGKVIEAGENHYQPMEVVLCQKLL